MTISPSEFLDTVAVKRNDVRPSEGCWAKNSILDLSRDNPDLQGRADSTKLTSYIIPIRRFCADNEVELATELSYMGKVRRKISEPNIRLNWPRTSSAPGKRERAICICELQSGQSNKQILEDMNRQASHGVKSVSGLIQFWIRESCKKCSSIMRC